MVPEKQADGTFAYCPYIIQPEDIKGWEGSQGSQHDSNSKLPVIKESLFKTANFNHYLHSGYKNADFHVAVKHYNRSPPPDV